MNKFRIFGTILLLIGVFIKIYNENEGIDFISGVLIGLGIGLVISGRINYFKK